MTTSKFHADVLTVGDLSRRSGIPIKAVREYTDHGLVNTMGRSSRGLPHLHPRSPVMSAVHHDPAWSGTDSDRDPRPDPPAPAGARTAACRAACRVTATRDRADRGPARHAGPHRRYERDHRVKLTGQRPLWARDARSGSESVWPSPRGQPLSSRTSARRASAKDTNPHDEEHLGRPPA